MTPKRFTTIFTTLIMAASTTFAEAENRIAIIQMSFNWGDVMSNIAYVDERIDKCTPCDMIILPELFTSGCDMRKRDPELKSAEKQTIANEYSNTVDVMLKWAQRSNAVVVGSVIYEQEDLFYNRLVAAYPTGELFHYDKHNCFKKGGFAAGVDHLVIELNSHRFATYICYDLRFTEWSRNEGRYDTAIYIANWPESRRESWHELLSERARENEAYVIGVNCVGVDLAGVKYMGESVLYNPSGESVREAAQDRDDILIVEY